MPYAYSDNGLSMRTVDASYVAVEGEILFLEVVGDDELTAAFAGYVSAKSKLDKLAQIFSLEATVTDRRVREAILGVDNGWMENINQQIAALRQSL